MRKLPEELRVNDDHEIVEQLTLDGVERILLSPSKCYLNDEVVQLEKVIKEIVRRYNTPQPTLFQIHHQNKTTFETVMIAQHEVYCQADMQIWVSETNKEHPLEENFQLLICKENSKYFVKCAEEKEEGGD